jgi:CRP/FNR family transcriptional regulator, cyclic AMP receptor protein
MARSQAREILAQLQAHAAFKDCSTADLTDLAGHSARTSVPINWPLIQQETPSDACYVILEGEADVLINGQTVNSLASGAVVGEIGLTDHKLRSATITSTTALDLLRIDRSEFESLLERRPALKAVFATRTAR